MNRRRWAQSFESELANELILEVIEQLKREEARQWRISRTARKAKTTSPDGAIDASTRADQTGPAAPFGSLT